MGKRPAGSVKYLINHEPEWVISRFELMEQALEKLAMMESFTFEHRISKIQHRELIARINFAQSILD